MIQDDFVTRKPMKQGYKKFDEENDGTVTNFGGKALQITPISR